MTQYRKKPVVVEAVQWKGYPTGEMCAFIGTVVFDSGRQDVMLIETLEGTMRADEGDWIIRGVKGEFYPCKPDIFAATYELAAAPAAAPAPPADLRCWEHRPGRGHARRCIREKGHKGQHVDFEAQYWTTGDETSAAAPAPPVVPCLTCSGRGWIMRSSYQDLGNGLGSGGAWNEPCPVCSKPVAASPAPAQAEGWQPKLQAIVERMRKYANRDDNGYVIDTWADEIADLLPPSAPDAETPK